MKQHELDEAIRALRNEKAASLKALKELRENTTKQITQLQAMINNLVNQKKQLQLVSRNTQNEIDLIAKGYEEKINNFYQANKDNLTRDLEDESDWKLIKELNARGFFGTLNHNEKPADFLENLNNKLNRGFGLSGGDISDQQPKND